MNDATPVSESSEMSVVENAAPVSEQTTKSESGWVVITLLSFYLLGCLAAATAAILFMVLGHLEGRWADLRVGLMCAAIGTTGGCLYCLRAVYLNRCVRQTWSDRWAPWYLIRPVVSTCCGGVSFLFLKAGLLVLESGTKSDASEIGFYALALVAGLNVDKFVAKIEDVAQAVWGIDHSRTRKETLQAGELQPKETSVKEDGKANASTAAPQESKAGS